MIKWVIAVVLVLAMLSVAGCCCCSGLGSNSGYYSTVKQDTTSAGTTGITPYDGQSGQNIGAGDNK